MATGTDQGDWETIAPGALVAKGGRPPRPTTMAGKQ